MSSVQGFFIDRNDRSLSNDSTSHANVRHSDAGTMPVVGSGHSQDLTI